MPQQPIEKLTLKPRHLQLLQQILQEQVAGVEVWAYGSRVNGDGHDGSDLDLVLLDDTEHYADLKEALQESLLPMLIDLHQWKHLPLSFQQNIQKNYIVIQSKNS